MPKWALSERYLNGCNAMIFIKFNEILKLYCLKISINKYGKSYTYNRSSRLFVSPNQLIDLPQKMSKIQLHILRETSL